MIVANSPIAGQVSDILGSKFSILINDEGLSKPLILWIYSGLLPADRVGVEARADGRQTAQPR
nr:hypothetical protein [uncultured Aliiroseovarius sp.]